MKQIFNIPAGKFASEDAGAKRRKEIRDALIYGKQVGLKKDGNAMSKDGKPTINTPKSTFAGDDAAARRRKEIRDALINGKTVPLKSGGNAMSKDGKTAINTPESSFAAQWYETNPTLLQMEKIAMSRSFPEFNLEKLEDDRLCWIGVLEPGIYESKFGKKRQYHIMAVYDNNHPFQRMGSSVRVYPLMPDVDEMIASAGFSPTHLLRDDSGNIYLCTNEANDQKVGTTTTTAASVLAMAAKWLIAFELVLTGELAAEDFNRHHGI